MKQLEGFRDKLLHLVGPGAYAWEWHLSAFHRQEEGHFRRTADSRSFADLRKGVLFLDWAQFDKCS